MPSVTHDGRSFMIDGRRLWLVSGRIPYARLPRESWGDRIHAARLAGLNCIETPVFWSRHEARPGRFDFTGDNDLRHFIDRVGKEGLYCILSIGPFIDSGWDFGGLPPWLRESGQPPLRTTGGPFLEACSRYITAVADQVRGWQVTAPGTGGPIVLLQCESEWTCGLETLGNTYLGELTRYIREAGLSVPVINSNNLWQGVEGQIDGWAGSQDLLATMRQLTTVRPMQPRMVIDLPLAHPTVWGKEPEPAIAPWAVQRRLAEVLAGGGQFNISTFCGGTNFGYSAARLPESADAFVTTSADHGAVITAAGQSGPAYNAVRRIATFASRFGRLFSNLDPSYQPVGVKPAEPDGEETPGKKGKAPPAAVSVVHAFGQQGGVAFVFGDPSGQDSRPVSLLLPDGSSIPVAFGEQSLTWCLFNTNISPRSRLDYSNLCALGSVGQALVCFGPAGARAVLSVNGSPIEADVPEGMTPVILEHEGLSLVIVSEAAADATFFTDDAVYVGVSGLSPEGAPLAKAGVKTATRVGADGTHKGVTPEPAPRSRPSAEKAAFAPWSAATMSDYIDGTSARYAAIDGPADLTALGSPYGYGWYRLTFKGDAARRARLIFPFAGDRLRLFLDSKESGLVGVGPGAAPDTTIAIHKGEQQLVILAENFGRFSGGSNLGEGKGIFGDIYEAAVVKPAKPKIVSGLPLNVLTFRAPLWEVSEGDTTGPDRLTWTLQHRKHSPVVLHIPRPPASGLLVLNDKPLAYLDRSGPSQVFIPDDALTRGNNTIQIALMPHAGAEEEFKELAAGVTFYEAVESFSAGAEMAFAKWEAPPAAAYAPRNSKNHAGPTWWRSTFTIDKVDHNGLSLNLEGMTKGQLFVNDRHLGRYFVATDSGKPVPPQHSYLVPAAWLKAGEPNEVVLFDEHGGNPSQVRVKA